MKAYFISGLGADRRAFSRIHLPSGYEAVYLEWIKPDGDESLPDYARRFSQLIDAREDFVLIGLSFGGMLASEIGKILSPKKIIIISSLATNREQPWYFRWAAKFGLHRLISPAIYRRATLLHRFMGAGDKEMKAIVYSYVKNADPGFIRWSLDAVVHWDHPVRHPNLVHIHGSRDHLLPCRYVHADYIVDKGGHLMIMNHASEVNNILEKVLTRAQPV